VATSLTTPTGEATRLLRTAWGMTQTEVASLAGIDQTMLSRIENGRVLADEQTVLGLAKALRCTPEFLHRGAPDILVSEPLLRAYADAALREVQQHRALAIVAVDLIQRLQLPQAGHDEIPVFAGDPRDPVEIEDHAGVVRNAAGLADGDVVRNATRAAERLRAIVLPLRSSLGKHLGMSTIVADRDVIFLAFGRQDVPGDRQRFSLAHELGHLALHRGSPPPRGRDEARAAEDQANRFAAAFLFPADAAHEEYDAAKRRITLNRLVEIKERWGVSVKGLIHRYEELHLIDPDRATSLYRQHSSRGWARDEPVTVPHESAVWFQQALARAVPGPDHVAAAGRLIGLHRDLIDRWLNWNPQPDAEVLEFRSDQTGGARPSRQGGEVRPTKVTRIQRRR
jgi:Zn-dependent peptidase ImmA (M78 family)/transcriptional regulator with XRE-family HTH domain